MRIRALPLALLATLLAAGAVAQPYNLASVNWVKYLKLSEGEDYAWGTCLFGDYLAVVGEADAHPALALLDRSTGEVVRKWVGEEHGFLRRCVSVGDTLYAAGFKRYDEEGRGIIYAFNKNLDVLIKNEITDIPDVSISITYDGGYLYTGGCSYVVKRAKSLEIINYKQLGSWLGGSSIEDVGINPVTGELWAVGGYEDTSKGLRYLIVILDKELRELKRVDFSPTDFIPEGGRQGLPYLGWWEDRNYFLGWIGEVCFDSTGNAYVSGIGVAKFDKNGNLLKVNKDISSWGIACVNGLVYAFSNLIGDHPRPAFYVLDSDLNILESHILGENANANPSWAGRPSFDGRSIYVAGIDYMLNRSRWVVYSLALGSPSPAYREEVNPLLLTAILVAVLALFVIAVVLKSMRKAEREAGAGGGEAKVAAGELARVEGYLARLEELRREGKVSEEAYRRLKEEYERERERLKELKPAQQAEHPTLRTCPKCGAPVEPEAKYCWRCGAKL